MPLLPIPSPDSWSDEIAEDARTMMNVPIDVIREGTPGTYNPGTDEEVGGTQDVKLIENRLARMQHIGSSRESAGSDEWKTVQRYRFQLELQEDDPIITKGLIIRVLNCPRDRTLESYIFNTVSAPNGSHAAIRSIEATTEWGVES